jgi:hypothetical protein
MNQPHASLHASLGSSSSKEFFRAMNQPHAALLSLLLTVTYACGDGPTPDRAVDASFADVADGDAIALECTYDDGGASFDASARFAGTCSGGCPAGTICARDHNSVGPPPLVAPEYCAPIPDRCSTRAALALRAVSAVLWPGAPWPARTEWTSTAGGLCLAGRSCLEAASSRFVPAGIPAIVLPVTYACGADTSPAGVADSSTDSPTIRAVDASFADGADGDAIALECTYDDGGASFDASARFEGTCSGGCPAGTVCAMNISRAGPPLFVAAQYCAPIPDRCKSDPSCACFASCVCGSTARVSLACSDGMDVDGGRVVSCGTALP